jgi:hypothetical protein
LNNAGQKNQFADFANDGLKRVQMILFVAKFLAVAS